MSQIRRTHNHNLGIKRTVTRRPGTGSKKKTAAAKDAAGIDVAAKSTDPGDQRIDDDKEGTVAHNKTDMNKQTSPTRVDRTAGTTAGVDSADHVGSTATGPLSDGTAVTPDQSKVKEEKKKKKKKRNSGSSIKEGDGSGNQEQHTKKKKHSTHKDGSAT